MFNLSQKVLVMFQIPSLNPPQEISYVSFFSSQCFGAMKTNSGNAGGTEGPHDPDTGLGRDGPLQLQELHFSYVKSEHWKWF